MALVNEWTLIMKKQFQIIIAAIFLITTLATPFIGSSPVSAKPTAAECDNKEYLQSIDEYYRLQNINIYDACSQDKCTPGNSTLASTVTIEKTPDVTQIYTYLTTTPLTTNGNKPLNAVQAAGIMGNFYVESAGFNPSAIEDTTRTQKGHGLAQWTFGRWTNLSNHAASLGKPWDTIDVQLDFLKVELEGTEKTVLNDEDFKTTTDPSVAAVRWRIVFERADPDLAHDDRRIGAAVSVYNLFGGSSANCGLTSGVVANDFLKTAKNFALTSPVTNGTINESDARDTYRAAKKQYNPEADWTDCGGYVAVSIIASGVDPNYPKLTVSKQAAYVRDNTDKYLIKENPTLADLTPGDILFVSGHTTIFTGDTQYPMLDASLTQRVPAVRPSNALQWMLSQPDIMAASLIK